MEIQDGNENETFDDGLTGVSRFAQDLKKSIFGIVFVLLKDHEMSIYITIILCILEFIQVIGLCFHKEFASIWGSPDIYDVVRKATGYTRFLPYLENSDTTVYSAILFVLVGILFLGFLNSIYVHYVYTRKKGSFSWGVILLRFIVTLITTILCLPVFEYMISFLSCVDNAEGESIHSIFGDKKCFDGVLLAGGIIGVIGAIFVVIVTFITTLTLFEGRNLPNNPISRVSSRANMFFTLYKFAIVLLLNFLIGTEYQIILIIFIMIGSIILFYMLQFDSPYYNYVMAKTWAIGAALNLWTAIMLTFGKIMENSVFTEVILTWLLGIPLVLFLTLQTDDKRMNYLLINVNQFENGKEIINQVTYLLKLLDTQYSDHNSAVLLDGYLEVHKQDCPEEACPLKRKNKVLTNNKIIRNLLSADPNLAEKEAIIVYLIYQIYLQGLKKFSSHTTLRIAYAFFLLDKMHSKQQALEELIDTEHRNPSLDEQFIIFRYKKIIEDDIAESQNEQQGGLDVVNEMSFQNHLRMCQANIEKAALLHMEFWSQLSEDQPDLAKLGDIGGKITGSVKGVEEYWNKLMKINPNNIKAMRLFGKFLIEIVHDRERGEELLDKARNLTKMKNDNKKNTNFIPIDDGTDEGTPLLVISGEQDRFAQITNINLACASLFGFSKTELMNRKLNALMPPIYAKYHDKFIEKYLTTNQSSIIGKNKERLAFGKNKSNYIFPFYYNLKAIPSIMLGIQFVSTIRVEKNLKNTAYVLTNSDGIVDSISSSCISLLKFDIKFILQRRIKIQECVPNILTDRATLFSSNTKNHSRVVFNYPKNSEYVEENEEKSTSLNCYLVDLLPNSEGNDNAGFQIRFEKVMEKFQTMTNQESVISNFQFRYAKNKANVIGEFADEAEEAALENQDNLMTVEQNDLENSGINREESETSSNVYASTKKNQEDEEEKEYEKVNFGIGIRTLRLKHGTIGEIEEEKSDDGEEKDEDEYQKFGRKGSVFSTAGAQEDLQDEGSLADFGNAEKSRKVLLAVISDRSPPRNLKNMKIVVYIIGLLMIGLSIFDYVNIVNKSNKINDNIGNLDISHQMIANMMMALSGIRDLYLVKKDVLPATQWSSLQNKIKEALSAAKQQKEHLELDTGISDAHRDLLNNPVVPLLVLNGDTKYKSLTQAIEEVITTGLYISGIDYTTGIIEPNTPEYYFVTINMLNEFYSKMVESSEYYAEELLQRKKSDKTSFVIVLVLSIVVLMFSLLIMIPVLYSVTKARDQILGLFFDIPSKTVKTLYLKCENFVSNLQVGEDDEATSEADVEEAERLNQENESIEWMPRKKKKKFKNTGKNYRVFFLLYFFIVCCVEIIFIINYINSINLLNNIDGIATEFNSTSYAKFFYTFSGNAQRQLFINSSWDILLQDAETVVSNNIQAMQDLDSQILRENSLNIGSHTDSYNDLFQQIVYKNPCSLLTDIIPLADCEDFAAGTITKGMTVSIVRHFENMRTLLRAYDGIKNSEPWPFPESVLSPPNNELYSLFIVAQAKETAIMEDIYIKNNYRILIESYRNSLEDKLSNLKTLRLILFILFLIEITVIYLFIWCPTVASLNTRLWKTKMMLKMIPIGVLVKIKNIRIYLRNFLNENHLHNY